MSELAHRCQSSGAHTALRPGVPGAGHGLPPPGWGRLLCPPALAPRPWAPVSVCPQAAGAPGWQLWGCCDVVAMADIKAGLESLRSLLGRSCLWSPPAGTEAWAWPVTLRPRHRPGAMRLSERGSTQQSCNDPATS